MQLGSLGCVWARNLPSYAKWFFVWVCVTGVMHGEGLETTFKDMERYLEVKGIGSDYNPEKYEKLQNLFAILNQGVSEHNSLEEPYQAFMSRKQNNCRKILPKTLCESFFPVGIPDEVSKSIVTKSKDFLGYGKKILDETQNSSELDKEYVFFVGRQILYSLFALRYEDRLSSFPEALDLAFTHYETKIKHLPAKARAQHLKKYQLPKEAKFLVSPESPDTFVSKESLSDFSHLEVSDFDVRRDHHLWYPVNVYKTEGMHLWDQFEAKGERVISQNLAKDQGFKSVRYRFEEAQKVVFVEGLRPSGGTHLKIRVHDAFGLKWKMKWGDEYFTEAVANRLYVALGGKYNDYNYAHTIENPLILVFSKEINASLPCESIVSFNMLKQCMNATSNELNSLSQSKGVESGSIDAQNIEQIWAKIPESARDSFITKEDILGRQYALIYEVSLEFQDKILLRHSGPMAQSSLGSENDRAVRGLTLLHLWLDNFDAKDANGASLLMKNEAGVWEFLQAPVDLGASFRGTLIQGYGLNFYKEEPFLTHQLFCDKSLFYPRFLLYKPLSFKKARFTDLQWMAKKIVGLSVTSLERAVAAGHTPNFYRQILVNKLAARQRRIAELYGLEGSLDPKAKELTRKLNIKVGLSTPEEIERAAKAYYLPKERILEVMASVGLEGRPYEDILVKDGWIQSCKNSIIINLLEKYAYPSGLSLHLEPHFFEHPQVCRFR